MKTAAIILVLHWGGFGGGEPSLMDEHVQALAANGAAVTAPAYPLGDPAAAERSLVRLARSYRRQGRRVVAYGTSAGGTLALRLGQVGAADAVVALAPVVDVVRYAPSATWSRTSAVEASPTRHRCGKLHNAFVMHARDDDTAPYAPSAALARRCGARLVPVSTGGHHLVGHPQAAAVAFAQRAAR